MKKAKKVFLILAAAFLLLGAGLCVLSVGMGADPIKLFTDGTFSVVISKNDPGREGSFGENAVSISDGDNNYAVSGSIDSVEIEWVAGKVSVLRGDGSAITFSESSDDGIESEYRLYYTLDGSTLKISCCEGDKISMGVNLGSSAAHDKALVVRVPYALENLSIDTTSADAVVDGVEVAKRLYADSTSGIINIKGIDCEEAVLHSTSGAIGFEGCAARLNVTSTSGDQTVRGTGCGEVFMHSTSGELSFDGSCRDVYMDSNSGKVRFGGSCLNFGAETTSGDVEAAISSALDEVDIECTSGDVYLTLPTNTGFTLEFDTASGSFNSDLPMSKRGDNYVFNGGGAEIDVDTTSGDLTVLEGEAVR